MTTYDTLKKIIPPDQALSNQALSRSLRQVKEIFNTDLPSLANAVSVLESNKDLDLINNLNTPLPPEVANVWGNTFATGTGPGNTITVNDIIGTASGNTHNIELPIVTNVLIQLDNLGELAPLTANGGLSTSPNNGIYTLMGYALSGVYSNVGNVEDTTVIPSTTYYSGPQTFANVDAAFGTAAIGLIAVANVYIAAIAANNSNLATISNQATSNMAQQLAINVENCQLAGLNIGNIVNDIANANLVSNSVSTVMSLTNQLHDIGQDVTVGGAAQFFDAITDINVLSGQAVVASMREGRNIAVLNAAGIQLDTQLVDTNPDPQIANNLSDGQYTAAQARANIVI